MAVGSRFAELLNPCRQALEAKTQPNKRYQHSLAHEVIRQPTPFTSSRRPDLCSQYVVPDSAPPIAAAPA